MQIPLPQTCSSVPFDFRMKSCFNSICSVEWKHRQLPVTLSLHTSCQLILQIRQVMCESFILLYYPTPASVVQEGTEKRHLQHLTSFDMPTNMLNWHFHHAGLITSDILLLTGLKWELQGDLLRCSKSKRVMWRTLFFEWMKVEAWRIIIYSIW